jgi:hypothetical protein
MEGISPGSAGLHDDAGIAEHLFARRHANAAPNIFFVGKSGLKPGRRLNYDFSLCLDQAFACAGRQRYAPFARERLARDADYKRYETPP